MGFLKFAAAFGGGAIISVIGYCLAKWVLTNHRKNYPLVSVVRQVLSVGYLTALFFIGNGTGKNQLWMLLGGALGVTVPALILTAGLLKLPAGNEKREKTEEDEDNG